MLMKIGIHHTEGFFSERWIAYCMANEISYKLVDCYNSDIIQQLSDCDALMWHFNHNSPKASKFAKQLLFSVQSSGKKTFPDYNTVWHFDDKVAQKYLLESIGAPLVHSYVFYDKREALDWAKKATLPKVFKLRNGASSDNVRLVKTRKEAYRKIKKSFGKGFRQYNALNSLKERYRKYRLGKTTVWDVMKGFIRLIYTTDYARVTGREVGYCYFQDFIPGNKYDIRVVVVGDKAFAIKRMVRQNDFRASGSGNIFYEKKHFNDKTIQQAFAISEKLQSQCMTYDFVFLREKPLIMEISYGFVVHVYDACTGYWDKDLNWHEGKFNPYGWMVEDLLKSIDGKLKS